MTQAEPLTTRAGAFCLLGCALVMSALYLHPAHAAPDTPATTQRVSVGSNGAEATGESSYPSVSADGHVVAFASSAANLVAGDNNDSVDVFVKDCNTGALVCASVSISGAPASGASFSAAISSDGQRVVFASEGSDLVAGDTNEIADVFVRDLAAQTTIRISSSASGQEADGASSAPRISADGRFVAFVSEATNLVPGDTNERPDVFVRDLLTGVVERISQSANGAPADGPSEGAAISADGRYVAFASSAMNLIAGENTSGAPQVWDVYVRDRTAGTTVRASASTAGGKGNGHSFLPAICADGRYVAFASEATNLISSDLDAQADVFRRDLQTGTTARVSIGPGGIEPTGASIRPSISADGRFVVFESSAANLVADPAPEQSTWTYVRDMQNGSVARVVAASAEPLPGGGTVCPALSADGHWVAFSSSEPTLVAGDSNALGDVFLRGPLP
ncbi:MAG: PD40 domain-containing protein [Planctomycetes bacterium]|nr:PD40 domain-containing protein [Planctomycetota bacterium]